MHAQDNLQPFVGIDSDGCALDSMELKHRQCFGPAFIECFELQPVADAAREVWYFVNLYSSSRGLNRFAALARALDLLAAHPSVRARVFPVPRLPALQARVEAGLPLDAPSLRAAIDAAPEAEINQQLEVACRWSDSVNTRVRALTDAAHPFPGVGTCLEQMAATARLAVVSQATAVDLEREWSACGLHTHLSAIGGQEQGSKTAQLQGQIPPGLPANRRLMIGDAPGDLKAAEKTDCLFFPICPGSEAASWQTLRDEAWSRFLRGDYAGDYQTKLLERFLESLPDTPSWV